MKAGKRLFIIRWGVLAWGLTTGLVWASVMLYVSPVAPWWVYYLIGLPLFMIGGWPFGEFVWWWHQRANQQRSS